MSSQAEVEPDQQNSGAGKRSRPSRGKLIGAAVALIAGIAIATLALTGGSDDSRPAIDPQVAAQQNYHQDQYAAGVSSGWPQDVSDRQVGGYLESVWHDPASEETTFVVDSRSSDGAPPPMTAAESARVQVSQLPHYRERGTRWIRLGGRPAVRWAYDVAGKARLVYFFEECDVSFVVQGTTPPVAWEALAVFFRGMATIVTANCDE